MSELLNVEDIFAEKVFTVAKMKERLPKKVFQEVMRVSEHGGELSMATADVVAKAMKLAKKMAIHMKEVLGCEGFNLVQNNGEVAGQTVFHFHLHLIPRYKDAKNKDILLWNHEEFTDDEMKAICESLKY